MKTRSHQDWRELYAAWQVSGKTKAEFCRVQNVSIAQFYNWITKLGLNSALVPQVSGKHPVIVKPQQTFVEFDIPTTRINPIHDPKISSGRWL